MIASDYVISCLATLMFNHAGEDLFQGMTCCGLLIRNRVLANWENQNWLKLIEDYDKHSANPPATPRVLKLGDPIRDDKFRRCLGIATSIYEGREKDITCGALRGCKLNECSPEFATKIIQAKKIDPETKEMLPLHPRVSQVGQWSFFR